MGGSGNASSFKIVMKGGWRNVHLNYLIESRLNDQNQFDDIFGSFLPNFMKNYCETKKKKIRKNYIVVQKPLRITTILRFVHKLRYTVDAPESPSRRDG